MDEELRIAFSKKEKVELFLSNLEQLKEEGSLPEDQYRDLKVEYTAILDGVQSSIAPIKARLRKEFEKKAEELESLQREQELQQIRFNVREIRSETYWSQVKPLRKKIAQLKKEVPKLQTLVNATSSAEIGGPAKVSIPELKLKKLPSKPKVQKKPAKKLPTTERSESTAAETAGSAAVPASQPSPSKDAALVSKLVKESIQPTVPRVGGISAGGKTYAGVKPAEGRREGRYPREKEEGTPGRLAAMVVAAALVVVIVIFIIGWAFSPSADSKPPAISGFTVSSLTGSAVTIEWATDEKATSQVVLRDPAGPSISTEKDKALVTKHSVKVSAIKPGTRYRVIIKSADASGNEAAYETDQTFTSVAQGGSTLPAISNVSVSGIADTSAVITWQTDKPATSQVMVSEAGSASPFLTEPKVDFKTSHTVTVTSLKPNVTYTFTLISKDASGNQTIYDSGKTFTTLASSPIGVEVGKRAPDFTLPMLDGNNLTLSSFLGKVVVLNFWQRSCPACVREMPMLQSVFTRAPSDKVVILGVNVLEDEATVKSFIDRWNLTFPIALDAKRKVANDYKVSDIPATFFLDGQGTIREIKIGPFATAEEIEGSISSIMK